MSYYAPSANKLMQLGPINWITNKWIDVSGNGNDADLVKSFCLKLSGVGGYVRVAHSADFDFGTGNFEAGIFMQTDSLAAGYAAAFDNANGSSGWAGISLARDGQAGVVWLLGAGATGSVKYTKAGFFENITDWYGIKIIRTGGRTVTIWGYDFTTQTYSDITATFTRVSIGGAGDTTPLNLIGDTPEIGSEAASNKWIGSLYGAYYKNAAGVKVLDLPFQGSGIDVSGYGNNAKVYAGTINLQGTQPNFHYNMLNGCDVYSLDADPTNRALWYYVPYVNGVPRMTKAQLIAFKGANYTLLRSCLPYRADAPLNLSETKIQFKSALPLDIMNKAPASISWAAGYAAASCKHIVAGVEYIYRVGDASGSSDISRTRDFGVHWELVSTGLWPGGTLLTICSFNGKLWIMGGSSGGSAQKKVWSTVDGTVLTAKTDAAWDARYGLCSFVLNNRMYVTAGTSTGGAVCFNDLWIYTEGTDSWADMSATVTPYTTVRTSCGCVVLGSKVYIMGGHDAGNAYLKSIFSWDGSAATWTAEIDLPTDNAYFGYCTMVGNIFIAGGYDGTNILRTVISWNGISATWTTRANPAAWTARYFTCMESTAEILIVFGGFDTGVIQDSWLSSDLGATWVTAEIYDPAKMSGTAFYDGTSNATKHTHYQEELNGKFRNGATRDAFKGYSFFGSYAEEVDASLYGLKGRYRAGIIYIAKQTGVALRQINKYLHGKNYT